MILTANIFFAIQKQNDAKVKALFAQVYPQAQKKYDEAETVEEKLVALEGMLSTAPNHKGAESLRSDIKNMISKLKALQAKEA